MLLTRVSRSGIASRIPIGFSSHPASCCGRITKLFANSERGGAFNLFEAAEFADDAFPLYVYDRPYTKKEIILAVASALYYKNPDRIHISKERRKILRKLCKQHGYDLKDPNFDPAMYGA